MTLESDLEALAPKLKKRAPQQLLALQGIVRDLKKGPLPVASQRKLKELFVWQLDEQRKGYALQLEFFRPFAEKGDAQLIRAMSALQEVLNVFDEAKRAVMSPGKAPVDLKGPLARATKALKAVTQRGGPLMGSAKSTSFMGGASTSTTAPRAPAAHSSTSTAKAPAAASKPGLTPAPATKPSAPAPSRGLMSSAAKPAAPAAPAPKTPPAKIESFKAGSFMGPTTPKKK